MRVYIDNCVLSRIANEHKHSTSEERKAIDRVWQSDALSKWYSLMTKQEIEANTDVDNKKKMQDLLSEMQMVPAQPSLSYSNVQFRQNPYVGDKPSTQDPYITKLRKIFAKGRFENKKGKQLTNDADHIFKAAEAGCDYFLTTDGETILKIYKTNLENIKTCIGSMKIVSPEDLLKEVLFKKI